ncbi:hypothetical protein GCM10009127_16200 [Alteraurantiacibacter aestuarii]|uniref:Uncharacterized protein n=1 Tax=Alteraurantiacibacter aestuarii TaxID=650004 RepID=A0A844ZJQ2_9SPHN|nr:hypothetical protein [Alteraurantiacibacter aestuarii]MXO87794.1 hypothetical protein [Alteraurantiacibacter aestuarii]
MAVIRNKFALAAATLAATSMTAIPVAAAQLPHVASGTSAAVVAYDGDAGNVQNHRWRRDRRGVNTGDVIAGVLVLGTIAAIASSASSNRDRTYDRTRVRDNDVRYREPARPERSWSSGGMDRAVDMCVDQVERGRDRVDSVDNAARDSSGWNVSGSLSSGDYFSCRIDNEGRIRSIDMGDDFSYSADGDTQFSGDDRQWSDDQYAAARASTHGSQGSSSSAVIDQDLRDDPRPAYPGGPLPGEEGYEASFGG